MIRLRNSVVRRRKIHTRLGKIIKRCRKFIWRRKLIHWRILVYLSMVRRGFFISLEFLRSNNWRKLVYFPLKSRNLLFLLMNLFFFRHRNRKIRLIDSWCSHYPHRRVLYSEQALFITFFP